MSKAELDYLTQLNFELMEMLELCLYRTQDFCRKNKIPFQDALLSKLLDRITHLIDEIDPPYFCKTSKPSVDFLQRKKPDKDFTEPQMRKFISSM
jgi:hypothetical protein